MLWQEGWETRMSGVQLQQCPVHKLSPGSGKWSPNPKASLRHHIRHSPWWQGWLWGFQMCCPRSEPNGKQAPLPGTAATWRWSRAVCWGAALFGASKGKYLWVLELWTAKAFQEEKRWNTRVKSYPDEVTAGTIIQGTNGTGTCTICTTNCYKTTLCITHHEQMPIWPYIIASFFLKGEKQDTV